MPELMPSGPPRHKCPFCPETFENKHSLSNHLSSNHHGERPVLLIAGREPGRISAVRQPLHTEQIIVENCSLARVSLNGSRQNEIPPYAVAALLAKEVDAIIEIELVNRYDAVASTIDQSYRLTIRIPNKSSVDEVDRAYRKDEPDRCEVDAPVWGIRPANEIRNKSENRGGVERNSDWNQHRSVNESSTRDDVNRDGDAHNQERCTGNAP